jgi:uncharacterized protein
MISVEEIRARLFPLTDDKDLRLIVLFGSAASGKAHCQSDIDLAFLYDGKMDILSLTNKILRLLNTDQVDVVDLRGTSPLLKFSIARKGIPIYERSPGLFSEFCSLAFRRYVDTKKLRDARAQGIRRFLESRGLA